MINVYFVLMTALIYFLGASIGSFLTVTVMRGHRKEDFVKGRSKCECCGKELVWWELIPSISYMMLGGKCSKCKSKIDPAHFIGETGLGVIFVAVFLAYMFQVVSGVQAIIYIVTLTILWQNVISDLLYQEVHCGLVYIAAVLMSLVTGNWIIVIALIALASIFLSKDNFAKFGAGDVDVLILIYASLGHLLPTLSVVFFASVLALVAYVLVIRKSDDKRIPFVPFLFAGYVLVLCGVML